MAMAEFPASGQVDIQIDNAEAPAAEAPAAEASAAEAPATGQIGVQVQIESTCDDTASREDAAFTTLLVARADEFAAGWENTDVYNALQDLQNTAALTYYKQRIIALSDGMKVFDLLDEDGSGDLTDEEIIANSQKPAVVEFIKIHENSPLTLLDEPSNVVILLNKIDHSGDGAVSKTEWTQFLDQLVLQHFDYLKHQGQLNGRTFFGRGLAKGDPDPDGSTCSWPDRGWASDFWYFLRNNHPIIGIFCHDKSKLSTLERINMEFVVVAWAFMITAFMGEESSMSVGESIAAVTLIITIPCMILSKILFYIHACPCLMSQYKPTGCTRCCYKCLECCGSCIGIMLFFFGLVLVAAGVAIAAAEAESVSKVIRDFAYARAQGYVLQPVILFALAFNPFHCMLWLSNCCCLFSMIGLATWQLERQQVRELLVAPLKDQLQELEGTHTEDARLGTTDPDAPTE